MMLEMFSSKVEITIESKKEQKASNAKRHKKLKQLKKIMPVKA